MMGFILVVHALICILLLLAILMQAGRGGGLTEQFASAENVFGAQTSNFMVRMTSILATLFFITCLALAFLSARKERSLMSDKIPTKNITKMADINIPIDSNNENKVKEDIDQVKSKSSAALESTAAESQKVIDTAVKDVNEKSEALTEQVTAVSVNAQKE